MEKIFLVLAVLILCAAFAWFALKWLPGKSKAEEVWPRLFGGIVLSLVLFAGLYFISPQQAEVAYYKFALVIAAAFVGYLLDRAFFPYGRPDSYLKEFWQEGSDEPIGKADYEIVEGYEQVYAAAMKRRALIIFGVILGATLGL